MWGSLKTAILAVSLANSHLTDARAQASGESIRGCVIEGGKNIHVTQNCTFMVDVIPKVMVDPKGFSIVTDVASHTYSHKLQFRLSFDDNITLRTCGTFLRAVMTPRGGGMTPYLFGTDGQGCSVQHVQNVVGPWVLMVETTGAEDQFRVEITPD